MIGFILGVASCYVVMRIAHRAWRERVLEELAASYRRPYRRS